MNKRRNRLQVIYDILKTIKDRDGRIKPTHILYKSNLSHQMMEEYLNELIKKEFIVEKKMGNSRTYSLTIKGQEFLNQYRLITNFVDGFGLE